MRDLTNTRTCVTLTLAVLKNATLITACVLAAVSEAANGGLIGSNLEQFKARYGVPVQQWLGNFVRFKTGEFTLDVQFENGKAEYITFVSSQTNRAADRENYGESKPLPDAKIAEFLKLSASGQPWKKYGNGPFSGRRWITADGKLVAIYFENGLSVMTIGLFQSTH